MDDCTEWNEEDGEEREEEVEEIAALCEDNIDKRRSKKPRTIEKPRTIANDVRIQIWHDWRSGNYDIEDLREKYEKHKNVNTTTVTQTTLLKEEPKANKRHTIPITIKNEIWHHF